MSRYQIVLSAAALIFGPRAATAQVFTTESGHASVTSHVPLHTFTGESDRLVGRISLADSTVDFYLDLTTLDSGIGKRDKDMRRTLETDEYPFGEFFGKLVSPFDPELDGPQEATVAGAFTIHGVTRQVEIRGTLTLEPEGLRLEAAWELNLADYEIVPPSLLIMKVDEVQEMKINAVMRPES